MQCKFIKNIRFIFHGLKLPKTIKPTNKHSYNKNKFQSHSAIKTTLRKQKQVNIRATQYTFGINNVWS